MIPTERIWRVPSLLLFFASVTTCFVTLPAMSASYTDCTKLLKSADIYSAGKLSEPYRSALVKSGRAVAADGSVDRITITNGCNSGAFNSILSSKDERGPNNDLAEFTEPKARAHFEKAGYKSIVGLKKDSKGIWRAGGLCDGNSVAITLDQSGNITAENGS